MAVTLGTFATAISGSGSSWNCTVPSGSNRIALYQVSFEYPVASPPSSVAVTLGGTAMTQCADSPVTQSDGTNVSALYSFYLLESSMPAAGTRAVVPTVTGGTPQGYGQSIIIHSDAKQAAPTYFENSSNTVAAIVVPSAGNLGLTSGGAAIARVVSNGATTHTFAGSVASWTERFDTNGSGGGDTTFAGADTTGSGSDVLTVTASSGARRTAIVVLAVESFPAGPTTSVQPTAQTARLNGDTTTSATFTSTCTGTGTVSQTAEIESGVGSGSYGTLANGSGATWTGLTSSGSTSSSITLVGTFSAKTLSGRRIRIAQSDSGGTTYSDAVVLTVLDGPVLSSSTATTNGSGVATVTMTSDDALSANGEILLGTATVRGQVVARTTVRPA